MDIAQDGSAALKSMDFENPPLLIWKLVYRMPGLVEEREFESSRWS